MRSLPYVINRWWIKINTIYINMEHEQILIRHGMINDGLKCICKNYLKYYPREDNMDKFRTQIASLQNI